MNLEAKIHEAWENNGALETALPVVRLFTGRIPAGTNNPCARLFVPGSVGGLLSDKARERTVQVRFVHWCDETKFGDGKTIQAKIEEAFDNLSLDLDDSVVVAFVHDNSFHLQQEDATDKEWQFVTQFTATVQKDRTL